MNIVIKDKNPIKLLTKKKYLEEDINIQAETEELDITPTTENQVKEGLFSKVTVKGTERYLIRVVDYDGTIIKEAWLTFGSIFELPEPPEHEGLVFDGWSSPVIITNNTVIVDGNIIIGPLYYTTSGATEADIIIDKSNVNQILVLSSFTFTEIDWGDGTIGTSRSHEYLEQGQYTVKIYGATSLPNHMFYMGNSLGNNLINLRFGKSVTSIGVSFCSGSKRLETIVFHSGLTNTTFDQPTKDCYRLKALILPPCKELLGVVSSCYTLQAVVVPYGVETLKNGCFTSTYSLKYLRLPDTISYMGPNNFRSMALEKLTVPKKIAYCDQSAFSDIDGVIDFEIPENESGIYSTMCYGCSDLRNVIVPKNAIDLEKAFHGTNLRALSLPESVTNVKEMCRGCGELEELYLPDGITEMYYTCYQCYSLRKVKLPKTLVSLSGDFYYGYSLLEIEIPETVETIGANTFAYCMSVRYIDFSKHKFIPTLVNTNVFQNLQNAYTKIMVPDELYDEWIVATNWSDWVNLIYKRSEVIDYDNN